MLEVQGESRTKEQEGGVTDMWNMLRKYAQKGAHRRKPGQSPSIYLLPREAEETW